MVTEKLVEIVENVVKSTLNYKENHHSVGELLFELLCEDESKIVLVDNNSGREWTASELRDAIVTLGAKLSQFGVSKGDLVAFFAPNSDLHVIGQLTVWAIGAVYTGLIAQSPLRELRNVINKTNAKYLIGSKETIEICTELLNETNTLKKFFVMEESSDSNVVSIQSLINSEISEDEIEHFFELSSKVRPTDLCKVSFSSGTTGDPKPVTELHRRYMAFNKFSYPEIDLVNSKDTCLLIQPLPHGGGSMILCLTLLNSAKVVVFSHFDINTFVRDVERHGITFAMIVPSYMNILVKSISEPVKSFCLKKVVCGGEFAPESLCKQYIEKFKPEHFGQGYGSTESGWVTIHPVPGGVTNLRSVGIPTAGFQIKIVDIESGKVLGANETGEICIKGMETTPGYLNNQKATKEAFDDERFLKSGDIGYFDERGHIYVIDRIKEVIKYSSQQVSPTELQSILLQHNSVKEAAVVGVRDEVYGELPKAFVVLKPDFKDKVEENELIEFVNSKVMDFKKLRGGLSFMSELPKTSLGKIDRKQLKLIAN